ncbi:unnamed protein product, partial [Coregonus sp. 'balchen']
MLTEQVLRMGMMKCRSAAPGGHLVSVHNKQPTLTCFACLISLCGLTAPTGTSMRGPQGEPIARWMNHEDCVEMNWSSKRWKEGWREEKFKRMMSQSTVPCDQSKADKENKVVE